MFRLLAKSSRLPVQNTRFAALPLSSSYMAGLRHAHSAGDSDPKNSPFTSKDPKDWPEEGLLGPYPNLPYEYYVDRPQDVKWDDQQGRRNLNEPLQHRFDLIDVWSPDHFDRLPDSKAWQYNGIFFGAVGLFSLFCWYNWEDPKFVRREYPFGGLYKQLGASDENKELFEARSDDSY